MVELNRRVALQREVLYVVVFCLFSLFSSPLRGEGRIKRFDVVELGVSHVKWVYLKFDAEISNIDHGTSDIQIERWALLPG